jgi:hypothetical protein
MRTGALTTVALAVTGVFVSVASAGAPMGIPAATAGEGRWAVGAQYGYERSDLDAFGRVKETFQNGSSFFWTQSFRLDDVACNMVFATLRYGVGDNWDVFARLGAADARDALIIRPADSDSLEQQDNLDGGLGLAGGVGTSATFCRCGPWTFGGLAQVTWFHPGDSGFTVADPLIPDESWDGDVTLKYWQAQAALAAVYQVDTWRLWAGPFLQFVRGDMDFSGTAVLAGAGSSAIRWTSDLQEPSQVGAQFGASWEFTKEWSLAVEGQITEDSWLVGVGAAFHPEREFSM